MNPLTSLIRKAALGAKALGARLFALLLRPSSPESGSGAAGLSEVKRAVSVPEALEQLFGIKGVRAPYPAVLLCAHSAEADEAIYADWLLTHPDVGAMIAPRQADPATIGRLLTRFGPRARILTDPGPPPYPQGTILILDDPEALRDAYPNSDIVYLGGGFDHSLTDIPTALRYFWDPEEDIDAIPKSDSRTDPATYAAPILFGPDYNDDPIAADLRLLGGAQMVSSPDSFLCHAGRLLYDIIERKKRARWTAEFASELLSSRKDFGREFGYLTEDE